MSVAAAGAGAGNALKQILAERFLREQEAARQAQTQEQMALQQQQESRLAEGQQAEETYRAGQVARQTRQDELAEAEQRQAGNERGVLQMMGGLVQREGVTPTNRKQLIGMLTEIGKMPTDELLRDPEAESARELADYEAKEQIQARYRPRPQGPQPSPEWVKDPQGNIVKRVAVAGDKPYDPVLARTEASGTDPKAEAIDTAREVKRIAGALRTHPGLPGVFGVVSSRLPTIRQSTADAETLLQSLQGLLTIENMGKMKGVLSDADMRILRQASTTLDAKMSEPGARAELARLERVMAKIAGDEGMSGDDGRDAGAGPQVGETRVINGQRAQWDGRGWIAMGQ